MVSLRLQKRLAANIFGCGKRKVWLDPNESTEISIANSRMMIRRLIKDGLIIRRPIKLHSRSKAREFMEAKRKGRHCGYGKRRGTKEARSPAKLLWMKRMRILRRLLHKYRDFKKIDSHIYHEMYLKIKGNEFKNKRILMENIHKVQDEKMREFLIFDQLKAKKDQIKSARERD